MIVYLFVFTVICLLGYAAIKPKADKWFAVSFYIRSIPVDDEDDEEDDLTGYIFCLCSRMSDKNKHICLYLKDGLVLED